MSAYAERCAEHVAAVAAPHSKQRMAVSWYVDFLEQRVEEMQRQLTLAAATFPSIDVDEEEGMAAYHQHSSPVGFRPSLISPEAKSSAAAAMQAGIEAEGRASPSRVHGLSTEHFRACELAEEWAVHEATTDYSKLLAVLAQTRTPSPIAHTLFRSPEWRLEQQHQVRKKRQHEDAERAHHVQLQGQWQKAIDEQHSRKLEQQRQHEERELEHRQQRRQQQQQQAARARSAIDLENSARRRSASVSPGRRMPVYMSMHPRSPSRNRSQSPPEDAVAAALKRVERKWSVRTLPPPEVTRAPPPIPWYP